MARLLAALALLVPLCNGLADTDTITWGGDNSRAGYQTNHNMDPSIVNSDDFAQIFRTTLPGNYNGAAEQVFSQPLVYTPSGGTTQYVYVATTQNNVYKLDAATGAIVASRNLAIPFLTADLDGCVDINPLIGITATGVIDPDSDTLYLTSKTYADQAAGTAAQGRPNGRYYIHALSVDDLAERPNFPVGLEGLAARNNPLRIFNGGIHHQRPALLHAGQYIYAGFASHCVQYNFTGWLIGFHKTTGSIVEHFATEGDGVPSSTPGAGIWMSGGGLASDDKGSLFFASGNGYASQLSTVPVEGRNPPTSLEEAAVHMALNDDGSVTVVDFFMPQEKQALDGADKDLGTSPLEILPSAFACGSVTRIGVVTGKSGKTYWLNLDDLGGYRTGPDSADSVIQVYQNENSVYAGAGVYPLEGGYIYINVIQYPTHVFQFSCDAGVPSFTKVADTAESNAYTLGVSHGTVTSLAGQDGTGLLWTTDVQGSNLRIYDAVPADGTLTLLRSFSVPGTTKFTRAVFGDARLYMGTTLGYVYGFGGPTTAPLNCSSPHDFGSLDLQAAAVTTTITCTAMIATTVNALTLADPDFRASTTAALPLALAVGATFSFAATFQPSTVGRLTGAVSIATTNGVAGYTSKTAVLLEGTGTSADALLAISTTQLTFNDVVIGQNDTDASQPTVFSNDGSAPLTITAILFAASASGPWTAGTNTSSGYASGAFVLAGVPATIAPNAGKSVTVSFNPTTGGNYTLFTQVVSTGGNQTFAVTGNAGPAAKCLIEFQTPDGTGWVAYAPNVNFTFGSVTENTARYRQMRITNSGGADAVPLSITVSKPPFGVPGIVQANNNVDLAEGTSLRAGDSATATLYCAVPKAPWNTDTYYGQANWTLNTNDPVLDKQHIQFACTAVAEQAPPLQPDDGQGLYRYAGCYKENNPGRQLATQLYSSDNNTAAMCIAACAAAGYTYCGTQYNVECWAGNTIPVLQVAEADCNYPCAGDLNQFCGGNGVGDDAGGAFISLFADPNASSGGGGGDGGGGDGGGGGSSSGPVVNPGVDGYSSIGCYHEPDNGRALANQLTANETVADCIAAARAQAYVYAGIEYGGECWAGNTLSADATAEALASCAMPCNGNASEYCGGSLLLNMYKLNTTAVVPSGTGTGTANSTSSVPTVPVATGGPYVNPGVSGYSFVGCYNEPADSRALANQLTVANQTVANCIAAAQAAGYSWAGLEYGGECWAGQTINADATKAATSACAMTCTGNTTEYCGGSLLLDVYYSNASSSSSSTSTSTISGASSAVVSSPTAASGPHVNPGVGGYHFMGCYNEPADSRALANQLIVANQTVANCLAAAQAAGYAVAGVEYGGECWAGSALNTLATEAATSACSMTCTGNTTEYCGGSLLLDVYQRNGTAAASISTPTTATAANARIRPATTSGAHVTASTRTTSPATTTAAAATKVTTSLDTTALSTTSTALNTTAATTETINTAASTISIPTTPSSTLASTNGTTTLPSIASSTASTSRNTTASTASTPSSPATPTTSTASSTTSSSAVAGPPAATPSVVINEGNQNFTLVGCYQEPSSGHLLSALVETNNTKMTVDFCLGACRKHQYAGLEAGRACWCGNALSTARRAVNATQCDTVCAGNATEYCGATSKMLVYNATLLY